MTPEQWAMVSRLPAFLIAVFMFYWSLPLCVVLWAPFLFLDMKGPRRDMYAWWVPTSRVPHVPHSNTACTCPHCTGPGCRPASAPGSKQGWPGGVRLDARLEGRTA